MLRTSCRNVRGLINHPGSRFSYLVIVQIDLRACKEITFSQTEQEPGVYLNAAITVFTGIFSTFVIFIGGISDAIKILDCIFIREGSEDTETVAFKEELWFRHQIQAALEHQGDGHWHY